MTGISNMGRTLYIISPNIIFNSNGRRELENARLLHLSSQVSISRLSIGSGNPISSILIIFI